MSYGLRLLSKLREIVLDGSMRISRFIWAYQGSTASSGSKTLDGTAGTIDIAGLKTVQFSIPINFPVPTGPNSTMKSSHAVSRDGQDINWSAYTTNYNAGDCDIFVFAYT